MVKQPAWAAAMSSSGLVPEARSRSGVEAVLGLLPARRTGVVRAALAFLARTPATGRLAVRWMLAMAVSPARGLPGKQGAATNVASRYSAAGIPAPCRSAVWRSVPCRSVPCRSVLAAAAPPFRCAGSPPRRATRRVPRPPGRRANRAARSPGSARAAGAGCAVPAAAGRGCRPRSRRPAPRPPPPHWRRCGLGADPDRPQHLGAGADRHAIADGRVALARLARPAEGDAVIDQHSSPISAVSPITTPMPWSMNSRRPIFAPGWISMPVMKRLVWETTRARARNSSGTAHARRGASAPPAIRHSR